MAIAGKVGAVYTSDVNTAPTPFSDKPTTADTAKKRYQVADPDFRYWSPNNPVTVKVDGEVVTTGFALEHCGGYVVFEEAQGDAVVLVSGKALKVVQSGGFFNWNLDADADDLDATTFKSGGWKEFVQGLLGWSGSAEGYWGDLQFFDSLGELLVVKLFVDAGASQACFEGFAHINSEGIETAVGELIKETIDFTGQGPLYPRW